MGSQQEYPASAGAPTQEEVDAARARTIEQSWASRHGAPTIDDYRRTYSSFGAEWPGDEEIRRRHLVSDPLT